MLADCKSECKFCIFHQYGVYVLNVSGCLVLLLVLIVYWREVINLCCGRPNKPIQNTDMPDQGLPLASDVMGGIMKTADRITIPIPTQVYGQTPVIVQQPTQLPPAPQPIPSQPLQQLQQLQPPPASTPPPFVSPTVPPSPQPQNSPNVQKLPPAKVDPFKLPTVDTSNKIEPHESTGSNYYKQMMRGKRPIASISQYALKKHKGKGGQKKGDKVDGNEGDTKRHHHHHHHKK